MKLSTPHQKHGKNLNVNFTKIARCLRKKCKTQAQFFTAKHKQKSTGKSKKTPARKLTPSPCRKFINHRQSTPKGVQSTNKNTKLCRTSPLRATKHKRHSFRCGAILIYLTKLYIGLSSLLYFLDTMIALNMRTTPFLF